jgi:ubiquinone/menaquinone biosynthesis C-methylase UbiE
MNETAREKAFRYDLFVASDWTERLDELVAKHLPPPTEGRLLEINCGTGARVIDLAAALEDGEVVGVDPDAERIAIAEAKALTANAERYSFQVGDGTDLNFESASFDSVVVDASLDPPERLAPLASEAVRLALPGAPVAVKVALRGSFDEFYSIYWEALNDLGLDDDLWPKLESLIRARPTQEEAVDTARRAGVVHAQPHQSKEEWRFQSGAEFLASPIVADLFLDHWLSIVPATRIDEVRTSIERTIDRERGGHYFDVSAKVLVVTGERED